MIVGGSLGAKIIVFYVWCMSAVSAGTSEVLIKYTGKYVKIYFNMKITYFYNISVPCFSSFVTK